MIYHWYRAVLDGAGQLVDVFYFETKEHADKFVYSTKIGEELTLSLPLEVPLEL